MSLTAWDIETMRPGRLRLTAALAYYRARLRRRWIQELLAVCGIATGVALLYASQVASTSLSEPINQINQGLVGHSQIQLLSRGPARFPERTYQDVVRLPGVVRAAPVLQVPGGVAGPKGHADVAYLGADPRVVKLRGTLLRGFSVADAARQETVVLPVPVARRIGVGVGDDIRIQIAGRTVKLPVVVAGREQIGSLVSTSIALVPLAYLQRLARAPGSVTRILVEAAPGRLDQVRRELRRTAATLPVDVRSTSYETGLFEQATKPWRQSSAIFSVLSALVGWLFAVCALMVSAAERRGLAREQRELGYPPSATLRTFLLDAAVVGVVGVVAGLALGEAISRQGYDPDLGFLSGAFPVDNRRIVTWESAALAAVGGLIAALIGVLGPLPRVVGDALPRPLRAAARDAGRAARSRHGGHVLLGAGAVALAVAVAITIWAPGAAVVGLVVLGLSLVLLLPAILERGVDALAWVNERRRTSIPVVLALQQLRSRRWHTRALAITATGAIAVFGATALQGARANLQSGLDSVVTELASVGPVWAVAPGAGSVFGTTEFPATRTADLAALPAVRDVQLYRAGLLDIAGRRAWVIGQPTSAPQPVPPTHLLEGDVATAAARVRAGGWAVVSHELVERLGLRIGDRFTLPAPRPVALRLAAVSNNLGWSSGAVIINAEVYRRAMGSDIAGYLVAFRDGVSPQQGRAAVAARLGPASPLIVETAAQRAARQGDASHSGLARLRQIAQLTLIAAVLAMAAAMTALLWQHRVVVADLKLNGLSTAVLWRALLVETAVLLGTGALAGGLFGLVGQLLCTRGIQVVTGSPVVDGIRLGTAGLTVGLVIAASVAAMAVPGHLVAKTEPDRDV
jgi:putative ABC transport system permease protein